MQAFTDNEKVLKNTNYGYWNYTASYFKHTFKWSDSKLLFFKVEVIYECFRTTAIIEESAEQCKEKWFTTDLQYSHENFTNHVFKRYVCASGRIHLILVEINGINVIYSSDIYVFVFPPHLTLQES